MRVTHLRMFSRFPLARHLATTTTNHNTSTLFSLLSPPEQAKFYAFSQRIQLPIQTSDTYLEALTHPSFNKQSQSPQFQKLQLIGESCLQMYSTEYCYFKFPKIQSDAMESLVKSFTGMSSLSDVGEGVGLKTVMQWTPSVDSEGRTGERAICARVFQALVGALYTTAGPKSARDFVNAHVLSRQVDLNLHLNLKNPKQKLFQICKGLERQRPVARLLKETGRLSTNPVFLVGVYSGLDKLGEGYGSSLAMAEDRAAKDALRYYFTKELEEFQLPSDDEIDDISLFVEEE